MGLSSYINIFAKEEKNKKNLPSEKFQKIIGYSFKNKELLVEALTHKSTVVSDKKSNQRLEFLGDAVLGLILSEKLFLELGNQDEGILSKARSALANGEYISRMAIKLRIHEYMILPDSADAKNIRNVASAREDTFEAIIGAVFLDSNFDTVKKVVLKWYTKYKENLDTLLESQNPKGTLQELAAKRQEQVDYILISEDGPSNNREFVMEVKVGKLTARASAKSKKEAQSKAAKLALTKYK